MVQVLDGCTSTVLLPAHRIVEKSSNHNIFNTEFRSGFTDSTAKTGCGIRVAGEVPMIKSNAMSCPLCGSAKSTLVQKEPASTDPTRSAAYTQRQVNLVICSECTFMYVERDFDESYVNGFYEEQAGGGYELCQEHFFWWHESMKGSNRHILSLLGPANLRRLLDVGCGAGTFLKDARDAGWAVSGLEINAKFPEFCRNELGIEDVKTGMISDPPFAEASFDAVTMLDVLEHMYDPVLAVTQCARLLKPGGVFVVKSPNGPMQLRKERFRKRFGHGTGNVAEIGHLNQFTPKTLSLAFRKGGLQPVRIRPAQSFQEGIVGPGFTPRRVARHIGITAANALMQVTGVGLNLVGIAKKNS
jgi:2-polyprenyl-3-methyl-5-hydroxy-6-metoxy-1,4-benzoquinol methylase